VRGGERGGKQAGKIKEGYRQRCVCFKATTIRECVVVVCGGVDCVRMEEGREGGREGGAMRGEYGQGENFFCRGPGQADQHNKHTHT